MVIHKTPTKPKFRVVITPPDTRLNPEDTPLHFLMPLSTLTIHLTLFANYLQAYHLSYCNIIRIHPKIHNQRTAKKFKVESPVQY